MGGRDLDTFITKRSSVTYSNSYAWLEACRWRGISTEDFIEMDVEEQARVIAHWEQHHKLQAVLSNTKGN